LTVELLQFGDEAFRLGVVLVALLEADLGEPAGMMVEDRTVGDADGGEELGIAHQEEQCLAVRELIDRERLAQTDPIGGIAADDEHAEREPAGHLPRLVH